MCFLGMYRYIIIWGMYLSRGYVELCCRYHCRNFLIVNDCLQCCLSKKINTEMDLFKMLHSVLIIIHSFIHLVIQRNYIAQTLFPEILNSTMKLGDLYCYC